MGLSSSYRAESVYHHQNDIVFLVLEMIRSGPGFPMSLDESLIPKRIVHCNTMFFEEPEPGACEIPSTSAFELVCQLRSGPDHRVAL